MKTYFNTTNAKGKDLTNYTEQAKGQEDKILDFLMMNEGKLFSAEDVHRLVIPHAPLTSARRSLSTLTAKNKIKQSNEQKLGQFKRMICLWYYPCETGQQKLNL